MSSAERSTFLVVLYKKLLPRAELEAIAERARASGVPLLRALEGRLGPDELERVERTLARHARRCGRCPALTYLLPGKREEDTPCERCGGPLLPAAASELARPPGPPEPGDGDAGGDTLSGARTSRREPPAPVHATAWDAPHPPADRTMWDPAGGSGPPPTPAPGPDVTMWEQGADTTGRGEPPRPGEPHGDMTLWERPAPPEPAARSVPGEGLIDQLERLARLRDAGVLSADEFERAKRRLLG